MNKQFNAEERQLCNSHLELVPPFVRLSLSKTEPFEPLRWCELVAPTSFCQTELVEDYSTTITQPLYCSPVLLLSNR
jgi:hypothetical protein